MQKKAKKSAVSRQRHLETKATSDSETNTTSNAGGSDIRPTSKAESPLKSAHQLYPARVFMRAADIPPSNVGAYGILALRTRPTPASLSRLRMACASYLASLPAQNTLPSNIPLYDQMLTIWPLETAGKPEAKSNDCDYLLNNYDLYGGLSAIQDADHQGKTLTGRGPYLIGWSPSNSRYLKDAVVLIIDLSPFDSQESFDEMFLIWQKRIVEDPELWRNGFSAERLRLAIRDFVDRYGQVILNSVKLVHSGG